MTARFAVIFDMDGVIVNNMPYHRKAWAEFFERHNPPMILEDFIQHMGKSNEDLLTILFGKNITGDEIRSLGEEKEALYREIYAPEVSPLPGFVDFLRSLKDNHVKTAVATAAPKINLDFLLEHIDVRDDFDVLIDDSEVNKGKPDPEIYLKAAERLKSTPKFCLVFEDSSAGIQAAIRAGMKVIGVATTHPPEKMHEAEIVINDFTEIDVDQINELMQENDRNKY
ncbi:MAG: HAD family phosphatase [Candidatus Aminicenantes bacterium]